MGWVTLSLRQMEDKVLVNNLELELLKISRRKNAVFRKKSLESLKINNAKRKEKKSNAVGLDAFKKALTEARENYNNERTDYYEKKSEYNKDKKNNQEPDSGKMDQAKIDYEKALTEYNEQNEVIASINADTDDMYDQELQELEEECTDEENELDLEQTQIETQLSAIRAELESVGQSVSQDIKSTAIKLA